MASSPPAPFPASLPNPRKRYSMSSQVSATNKRPKLHPLRQTSFPANHDANAYASAVASARSETGSVANSTFSTMSQSKQPRGRGRPRKSLQVTEDDARVARDGGSTAGGKGSKAKSVISTAQSAANAEEDPDEDDEEEEAMVGGEELPAELKKAEEEKLNIFLRQLSDAQSDRYAHYRSGKLTKSVVRRIVNQTVSQSVNEPCVAAVMFAGKAFAIEIIERARDVQTEYAKAADVGIHLIQQTRIQKYEEKEKAFGERENNTSAPMSEQEKRAFQLEVKRLKDMTNSHIPNKHRGGLLPDHLREALRRYKADGDGNGFGFDGLSHPLLGVRGSRAWRVGDGSSGRRLFR